MTPGPGPLRDAPVGINVSFHATLVPPNLPAGRGFTQRQGWERWGMERRKARSPNAHIFQARDSGHKTAGAPGRGAGVGPRAQTGTRRGNGTGAAEGLRGSRPCAARDPTAQGLPCLAARRHDGEGTAP